MHILNHFHQKQEFILFLQDYLKYQILTTLFTLFLMNLFVHSDYNFLMVLTEFNNSDKLS